jgi:hypothetical protein
MGRTNLQVDGELGEDRPQLPMGQDFGSLGPPIPLLRSLGLGFALGAIVMGLVALLT